MYKIGDYIIYGTKGVCRVVQIGPVDLPDVPSDRLYYTLELTGSRNSRVFTPVDNSKVIMRPVLTQEEASALIAEIRNLTEIEIEDEKHREDAYRDVIRSCDCRELVRIIKTLYQRNQSRLAEGKKITSSDDKYFHLAEDNLYSELAISLDIPREEVKDYIMDHLEGTAEVC